MGFAARYPLYNYRVGRSLMAFLIPRQSASRDGLLHGHRIFRFLQQVSHRNCVNVVTKMHFALLREASADGGSSEAEVALGSPNGANVRVQI